MSHDRLLLCLSAALVMAGCASSQSGAVYTRAEARRPVNVASGEVIAVRPVRIEGTKSNVGTGIGAAVGGVGGALATRGSSNLSQAAAGLGGAIVGGLVGAASEELATRANGIEITVRLDDGRTMAYVQTGAETFQPGDRVLITTGAATRVTHAPQPLPYMMESTSPKLKSLPDH
jgi:outer membrane lipoprotein SlyB